MFVQDKRGTGENWMRGIFRSSEPATVDRVLRENGEFFRRLNAERFLRLGIIWNEIRFD